MAKHAVKKNSADKVDKSMVAVCGKCNIAIELHPVPSCPYRYKPIILNGRRYGWHMTGGD